MHSTHKHIQKLWQNHKPTGIRNKQQQTISHRTKAKRALLPYNLLLSHNKEIQIRFVIYDDENFLNYFGLPQQNKKKCDTAIFFPFFSSRCAVFCEANDKVYNIASITVCRCFLANIYIYQKHDFRFNFTALNYSY